MVKAASAGSENRKRIEASSLSDSGMVPCGRPGGKVVIGRIGEFEYVPCAGPMVSQATADDSLGSSQP
jgi:hypothetical protein